MQKILYFLNIVFVVPVFGQSFTIVDVGTGERIPYATVKVLNSPHGQVASGTGDITLANVNISDTILITAVGYNSLKIGLMNVTDQVGLQRKADMLETITIMSKQKVNEILLGNGKHLLNKKIKCVYRTGRVNDCAPWEWSPGIEYSEEIILPDTTKSYRITQVYIPVEKRGECWEPLLLHIYLADSVTGRRPGEKIFIKQIDVRTESVVKGKIRVDLAAENIVVSGVCNFFIGVSWDEHARQEACKTALVLPRGEYSNTYFRTLQSPDYKWLPFTSMTGQNGDLNTAFIVRMAVYNY